MDMTVVTNNGRTFKGDGSVDEMGITIRKTGNVVIAGKEDEMTLVMIPWHSVDTFEYVITPDMLVPPEVPGEGEVKPPNRAARRAAMK